MENEEQESSDQPSAGFDGQGHKDCVFLIQAESTPLQ